MLTRLFAALAICLVLAITPLTSSPAYAEAGCEGRAGESPVESASRVTVDRAVRPR